MTHDASANTSPCTYSPCTCSPCITNGKFIGKTTHGGRPLTLKFWVPARRQPTRIQMYTYNVHRLERTYVRTRQGERDHPRERHIIKRHVLSPTRGPLATRISHFVCTSVPTLGTIQPIIKLFVRSRAKARRSRSAARSCVACEVTATRGRAWTSGSPRERTRGICRCAWTQAYTHTFCLCDGEGE